eukprot:c21014_g1_i1 orf=3-245(-)
MQAALAKKWQKQNAERSKARQCQDQNCCVGEQDANGMDAARGNGLGSSSSSPPPRTEVQWREHRKLHTLSQNVLSAAAAAA